MGYEPKIIILKSSIDKHRELIEDGMWQYEEGAEECKIMSYIQEVYQRSVVKIGGIEILICEPEGSYFSMEVREKLHELNIEFEVD